MVTSKPWTFLAGCTYLHRQGRGGRLGSCYRHHPPFDVWEHSPDPVHQKCLEDDAGVRRVVNRAGRFCREHEVSEVGSQHDRGGVEAGKNRKDTPDNAVGCVVDRHDDCKGVTVTAGEVKGNCVL